MPLFPVKIVKLSSFISVIHMQEGALALTSHIALVYLPNSLMLCIKFGCDSSPLYFHTLQHPLWACFCVLVQWVKLVQTLCWLLVEEAGWTETQGLSRQRMSLACEPPRSRRGGLVDQIFCEFQRELPVTQGKNAYLRHWFFFRLITPSGLIASVLSFACGSTTHSWAVCFLAGSRTKIQLYSGVVSGDVTWGSL